MLLKFVPTVNGDPRRSDKLDLEAAAVGGLAISTAGIMEINLTIVLLADDICGTAANVQEECPY